VRNLALQLAAGTPVGTTPLLDYLIVSSDSVGQGLDRLIRYLRLVNPGLRLAIEDRREPVRVVIPASLASTVQREPGCSSAA
jgi:Arabinose-binding domain of AraC transcription regulator, N-term